MNEVIERGGSAESLQVFRRALRPGVSVIINRPTGRFSNCKHWTKRHQEYDGRMVTVKNVYKDVLDYGLTCFTINESKGPEPRVFYIPDHNNVKSEIIFAYYHGIMLFRRKC